MASRIEIAVFGNTRVRVDGRPQDLGGGRVRALLAALVATGDPGLSTDAIVDAVWGTDSPSTARKSVQKYVSRLRSQLGADVIETTATGYRLIRHRIDIDVDRCQALAREANEALDGGDPAGALTRCEAAARLAEQGEPFADLSDTNWANPVAQQIREAVATAQELTSGRCWRSGGRRKRSTRQNTWLRSLRYASRPGRS